MTDRYDHYKRLQFDRPHPHVLRVTMAREDKLNAAADIMHRELTGIWNE
jgi:enoyl-CoA hydratase